MLVSWTGIKPKPLAMEAESQPLNHQGSPFKSQFKYHSSVRPNLITSTQYRLVLPHCSSHDILISSFTANFIRFPSLFFTYLCLPSTLFCTCMRSVCYELVAQSCQTLCDPRLLCPWNSLSKNTRVGSHSLLQETFPVQGLNPGLQDCRQILYHPSQPGVYFV